jgi:hypothetical protein
MIADKGYKKRGMLTDTPATTRAQVPATANMYISCRFFSW